jgi:hypothetical protein
MLFLNMDRLTVALGSTDPLTLESLFSLYDKTVYGYMTFCFFFDLASYAAALYLFHCECTRVLPSPGRWRGHSVHLLLFWTLAFAKENVYFANWPQAWAHGKGWPWTP